MVRSCSRWGYVERGGRVKIWMTSFFQGFIRQTFTSKYLSLLGLLLVELTALGNASKDLLTVLVELEGGDDDLGGGDAEGNGLAVGLLAGDAVDVDDPLETVDRCDLALAALVGATDNGDLIVLADGDRADLNDTFISIIQRQPIDEHCLVCL